MTVSYRNTFGDLLAFSAQCYLRSWLVWLSFALLAYSATSANVSAFRQAEADFPFTFIAFVIMELVVLLGIIVLLSLLTVLANLSRRNKTTLTNHVLTLSADGLREETPYNVTTHTWSAIQKVSRTRRHLFLFVGANSAHVVPRRSVGSEADWDALHEMARSYSAASV